MAAKLAEAKRSKGTLTLNNGKILGGSWKTPELEFALQSRSGYKGGETGQQFYMKFPVYRPRGHHPPDPRENQFKVWETQIKPLEYSSVLPAIETKRSNSTVKHRLLNG